MDPCFNGDVLTFPAEILATIPAGNLTPSFSARKSQKEQLTSDGPASFLTRPQDNELSTYGNDQSEYLTITTSTTSVAIESHLLPLFHVEPYMIPQPEESSSKCFTVWRLEGQESYAELDDELYGGRRCLGTLHYLSQSC